MERIKLQINKINIVSAACVMHQLDLALLSAIINGGSDCAIL